MLGRFHETVLVDFEYAQAPGERPTPVCLVAWELTSGRRWRLFQEELRHRQAAPYPCGPNALVVSYYASAELSCHLALGWSLPANVLDLFAEYRNTANGLTPCCGWGLLGALAYFGLDAMGAAEKDSMRALALRGGPYSIDKRISLLNYCEGDVAALARLLPVMTPHLDLDRALLRGRYMSAVARMEFAGVPLDAPTLGLLRQHWDDVVLDLVRQVDATFGVYQGKTFKHDAFRAWINQRGIVWPRLKSGKLRLDQDTFRDMVLTHPELEPLKELRATLSELRLTKLAVGDDNRNRCMLSAYQAVTGRNQPSTTGFIFGPAKWMRGLKKPGPGMGLAYLDYDQQEFGIAAALSGDAAMQDAYLSGDCYLAFAKQAGEVPEGATKESHGQVRDRFKQAALGVQYGMGAKALARKIDRPLSEAKRLLRLHHQTYPQFWLWSDAVLEYAAMYGRLYTAFGWQVRLRHHHQAPFLRNFPMQANGAEILRLACILVTEAGITVCCPVHDALLIEAPLDNFDQIVARASELMIQAGAVVLGGFELRVDAKLVRYPDRYMDRRGAEMWTRVMAILDGLKPAIKREQS